MNYKTTLLAACLAGLLGAAAVPGSADDIDLYTGGEQNTGAAANVLFVLDNSTNWAAANQQWADGKQGESELQTMSEIIGTLSDNVNLGLLMASNENGGYVRFAVREMNATTKPVFQSVLNTMYATFGQDGNNDDKVNAASISYDHMLNSTFRYFNGVNRWMDNPSPKTDLRDFNGNTNNLAFTTGLGNYSLNSSGNPPAPVNPYLPPGQAAAGCAKNYIIFIGNGYPTSGSAGAKSDITNAAALVGLSNVDTSDVAGGDNTLTADEWTRFMYKYGVESTVDDPQSTTTPKAKLRNGITTYTIDVCKDACDPDQEKLLTSMADQGGGEYFKATSKQEIKNALATIFAKIQAVNSVFASATLPVSVNTQGTYENQVYIGVFRPDQSARPRWFGNLKEYQFARYCDANGNGLVDNVGTASDERIDREAGNTGTVPTCTGDTLKLFLADRNNKPAIDQSMSTGFIDLSATSFWTTSSTFWTHMPVDPAGSSDAPDGPNVERGAAAQKLRATWAGTATSPHPDGRKIYTCWDTCLGTSGTNLSGDTFTTTNSSVATALAPPSGSATVTLARSGNTVTATSASAHGFADGSTVTIAGATPSDYNGTKTITVTGTSSFTYPITETPATSDVATAQGAATAISVSQITLSGTTAATTVTATVSATNSLSVGGTVTIANASQSFLNGAKTVTAADGSSFQFLVTLPASPTASTTTGSAVAGGDSVIDATLAYSGGVVTGTSAANLPNGFRAGNTVRLSAYAPSVYNGDWTISNISTSCVNGTKNKSFCFVWPGAVSPDPGTGTTATPSVGSVKAITITRTLGSSTATGDVGTGNSHGLTASGTVNIAGAANSAYNGTWTVLSTPSAQTFTFGPVTLAPATPPTGTITATAGTSSTNNPSAANLINWMRGKDLWEDENLNKSLTDVRASIHGDVLHSRPLLINYGGSIGIVGFYGSNDGYLRAIEGGTADTDGVEKWAFIPKEFVEYTKLSRLYRNSEAIRYPNLSCSISPAPTARNYFWDGPISSYQSTATVKYPDAVTGPYTRPEKTYIYAAMRRGGRALYALDVSDPDTPNFLWKISNTTTNFSQLGQTWSEPKVARLKGKNADGTDDLRDVLIFGAGYDPTDDDQKSGCVRGDRSSQPVSGCFSGAYTGIGRGVFIVDALTGAYINRLQVPASARKYSFPGDVTLLDVNGDGYVDRIYAGDSGAQLFRFDADATKQLTASDAFKAYHLASLGDAGVDGGSDARKFLFAPEVLPFTYKKSDSTTVAAMLVLAGSGDREKPLANRDANNDLNTLTCSSLYSDAYYGSKIRDQFYGFIDTIASGTDPATVTAAVESNFFALNNTTVGDETLSSFDICYGFETNCDAPSTNSLYKGWFVRLKNSVDGNTARDEEKLVSAPKVVSGMVLFGTNTPRAANPSAGICSNLGQALAYAVDPFSGMPKFDRNGDGQFTRADYGSEIAGGGLPPTVTAGVVGIGGGYYRFVIGACGLGQDCSSPIEGAKNPISLKGTRSRVYWYYPVDDK